MIGRIPILDVEPVLGCGRRPAKAVPGETFDVSATVLREGHEMLGAGVVLTGGDGRRRPLVPMHEAAPGTDRYVAQVCADGVGRWQFHIEAWGDPIARWRHDAAIKVPRCQDVELVLADGAALLRRAARRVGLPAAARRTLTELAELLGDTDVPAGDRLAAATTAGPTGILARYPLRELVTRSARYPLVVHRQRALYGAWYEFFPRSEGAVLDGPQSRSGTLQSAARRLPAIAAMGFDVVYLPPIHPIGHAFRKGRNNTLMAGPGDPGSPWAIGGPEGGHEAVHPDLGTLADFDAFVARAGELGMEVALDLALQCSPDHPWVAKHPEWFTTRSDGSIAYAENPPKKYQDIYPLNFDNDPEGSYAEVRALVQHWMDHGVRIFRVDNPHTKPVPLWERLLADVQATDPDVLFLAEAFTRPAMLHTLARAGFHQSYTYFTWRNSKEELQDYLSELAGPCAAYLRPNLFVNTPDILHAYLQHGGRPAFEIRAVLAAMAGPTWGMYSGFELCENTPIAPGSEEYLDSEKYQYRPRDWAAAERAGATIAPLVTTLNRLRRTHPALHYLRNLRLHDIDSPDMICFSKRREVPGEPGDTVLVVVNLDPHNTREATVRLDMPALGLDWPDRFVVHDELSGESHEWQQANYVRLDPSQRVAHVFTLASADVPVP